MPSNKHVLPMKFQTLIDNALKPFVDIVKQTEYATNDGGVKVFATVDRVNLWLLHKNLREHLFKVYKESTENFVEDIASGGARLHRILLLRDGSSPDNHVAL